MDVTKLYTKIYDELKYPISYNSISEANLQHHLSFILECNWYNTYLEYKHKVGNKYLRVDIALLDKYWKPFYFIEVKNSSWTCFRDTNKKGSRQYNKYADCGIVFSCFDTLSNIDNLINSIKSVISKRHIIC